MAAVRERPASVAAGGVSEGSHDRLIITRRAVGPRSGPTPMCDRRARLPYRWTGMRDPDDFDAFYKDAREPPAPADLRADRRPAGVARRAVRDAFVVAWHHWRKVSRLDDPEASVRPQAWAHAQRRHTARVWHRDKNLDPEVRATLDALGKLSLVQRKVLLLTLLTTGSLADIAREVGLPREAAERELQTATATYARHRGIASSEARRTLEPLRAQVDDARLPRAPIIRRAGAARRRTHTSVGVLATVAALVVSGVLVTQGGNVRPALADDQGRSARSPPRARWPAPPAVLSADDLLGADQVTRLAPERNWTEGRTSDNSSGTGMVVPCRQARNADPGGGETLMRRFSATKEKGEPALSAVQISELSVERERRAGRRSTPP